MLNDSKDWAFVEKHLDRILDMVTDPVIIINDKGVVVYVNQGYERQVGVSREKVLDRNLYEHYPNDKLLQVLEKGQIIEAEEHYNETLRHKIVAGFLPIKNEENKVMAVAGIGTSASIYHIYTRLSPALTIKEKRKFAGVTKDKLHSSFQEIIGEDPRFLNCLNLAAQVAGSDASIILRGETGVGKELIARAIHETSDNFRHPFITVNCAAIPENLIESELFGYAPGAFTGAQPSGKVGKIELANKGTLFLDEIGDLTLSTQVKLLRFLQERYIERIGGNEQISINTRIITATNRNLEQMVQQGEFRMDLYFRVNVIPVYIPPLRERPADILILAYHFLDHFGKKYHKKLELSTEALEYLQRYNFPGNVRELKNIIEHAVIVCSGETISSDFLRLPFHDHLQEPFDLNLNHAIEYTEKTLLEKALEKAQNNKSKAIEYLGISRGAFYAKMEKYGLHDVNQEKR